MDRARSQDGGDQLVGLAVKDQQGVVHVLLVVPVIGTAFLLPMGRIVGAVQIEDQVGK
jgi:hypothetical protein